MKTVKAQARLFHLGFYDSAMTISEMFLNKSAPQFCSVPNYLVKPSIIWTKTILLNKLD